MASIIGNHNVTYLECQDCGNAFTYFNSCYIYLSLDYIEHNKTITISTLITRLFHLIVISNIFYHEGASIVFNQANNEHNNIYLIIINIQLKYI